MNLENLSALAAELPESVRQNAIDLVERMGEVIEGVGDRPITWRPGNLRLVQGTTDRSSLPKGTAVGDFILGEAKLAQPLKVIPIRMWDGRQMWSPDKDENKMLCSSPDARLGYIGNQCNSCPHSKWDEAANKSDCGRIKTVLVIDSELKDVFTVTFAKTNYKVGMEFEGMMKKAKTSTFKRVYGLSSKTNTQHKNVDNFNVEMLGDKERTTAPEMLAFLTELFNQVSEDRKVSIEEFYKIVLDRKQNQPQLADASGSDSTVLLETSDVATEAGGEGDVSPLAKGYSV
jgi:hypothetical protein